MNVVHKTEGGSTMPQRREERHAVAHLDEELSAPKRSEVLYGRSKILGILTTGVHDLVTGLRFDGATAE